MCRAGASWVQRNLLERHPDADLRVYAVWFGVLGSDSRDGWDGAGLTDARVGHYWDEAAVGSRFFGEHVTGRQLEWDSYFLYGTDAWWEAEPGPLVVDGHTVIARADRLRDALEPLVS